ncbi:MAG: sensor histidine kinase [Candidatus Cryptobacteroides sp.]
MVRNIVFLMILSIVAFHCAAQNNRYKIDDSCYQIYRQADSLIGYEGFQPLINQLQVQAEKVGDKKAVTLAMVLRLRNATALKQEDDIIKYFDSLKGLSLKTGYLQYYFYAYQLVSVYYFNAGFKAKGLDYANKMHDDAVAMDNDYGLWLSSKYLGDLNWVYFNRTDARRYYLEATETYDKTDDVTIKTQSMSKTYICLAFTYDYDSVEYEANVDKALETSKISIDTILVNYCRACNAVVKKDISSYNYYKAKCLSNPLLQRAHKQGASILEITDCAIKGNWDVVTESLRSFRRLEDLILFSELGVVYGNLDIVRQCYDRITQIIVESYEDDINQALKESDLRVENDRLNQRIIKQKSKLNYVLSILIIFIVVAVIFVGCITFVYVLNLRRAKKEADNANRMKTSFVQNMSHEIRTPLNAVVGYSQLLAMPDLELSNEDKEEYCEYINNNSSLLMMLIDDILDLSDIDSGNYRMFITDCNCNEICRMAIKTVECRVPSGVELNFSSDVSDDFTVKSDAKRVQQIIINYLTNSCKHTLEGEILLGCTCAERPGYVSFYVQDTGTGIPPEEAENIFHRFSKLDKFKQGSGLGLNICMVLAEKLGGIVELDKNYGRCSGKDDFGARFVFHLLIK